jgi:hypothetical protein
VRVICQYQPDSGRFEQGFAERLELAVRRLVGGGDLSDQRAEVQVETAVEGALDEDTNACTPSSRMRRMESLEDPSWETFECAVDGPESLAWLEKNRPEVVQESRTRAGISAEEF